MVVKTKFSKGDFIKILSNYDLGKYKISKPFSTGAVQTNLFLQTTKGRFVFRYYESRSKKSVLFEINLIRYLKNKKYPCPAPFKNRNNEFLAVFFYKIPGCPHHIRPRKFLRFVFHSKVL